MDSFNVSGMAQKVDERMKIAITGGAGFIGSRLADGLRSAGHEVIILDIAAPDPLDATDEAAMMEALYGVDAIYNLAAEHRDDVSPASRYYDVNVGGAEILVKAAEAHDIKTIIFTSSVAVYGLDAGESSETDTPAPFNDYGASKLQAEKVFDAWAALDGQRRLVTVRLVATFGRGNRGNIYTLMDQIACGRFVMVGAGRNYKSVAYVENVAAFLQYALGFGAGAHLYNYADKPDLNMRAMVRDIRAALGRAGLGPRIPYMVGLVGGLCFDMLAKLTGKKFPISKVRVEKFCANTVVNADKAHACGFTAPVSLQVGLDTMIKAEFHEQ